MSSLYNFCWEFSHEFILAEPSKKEPPVFILNAPRKFAETIEIKMMKAGFRCVAFMPHGQESVILRFKKSKFAVEN